VLDGHARELAGAGRGVEVNSLDVKEYIPYYLTSLPGGGAAMRMAKMTSKNQLTLPKAVVEALGSPTHFRVQVHDGVLLLWPGALVSTADKGGAVSGGEHSGKTGRA
jgi:hypothetical protein